ncbi:HNH endonuclease [Synechococcus sp. CCY 9618]|uniref:HNH endonuclease n=1 Tax=Synechococcus sp. CCY 9618 TaxID=2815602 RepID=UPI001C250454|nr:HNH endonuclease [Synechococcus sp. CCY 9618]
MATPADHPLIFLFTGSSGESHGYHDEFRDDGTFWYTGEGQFGDMKFERANRALRDHASKGKAVHVFEAAGPGLARYLGEMEYLGHHLEERPDTNGDLRQAIVFELGLVGESSMGDGATESPIHLKELRRKSLAELKELAIRGNPGTASSKTRRQTVRIRSEAVREYVLRRANGTCEGCGYPAPFFNKKGAPYLEPHHTTRVADGGPDHPSHVIALCPTCHRRVHHGKDGDELNQALKNWLQEHDPETSLRL